MNNLTKKHEVLHITLTHLGGLGTFLKLLSNNMKIYSQSILCFSEVNQNFFNKDFKILKRPFSLGIKDEILYVGIWKYLAAFKKADVIHVHHTKLWLFTTPLFLFAKKIVFTFHTSFGSGVKKNILEKLLITLVINYCLIFSNKLVFLTKAQKNLLRPYSCFKRKYDKKSLVINNFISSDFLLERKNKSSQGVLFVGRYTQLKGFNDLIEVAKDLKQEQFYLVGDDDYVTKLKNVYNIGTVDYSQIHKEYDKHSIFILPSYTEAFPMSVLEAMSRGLVVLLSDIPGMNEIIKEGENGFLFEPGDTHRIKEILLFLSKNPSEVKRISDNNLKDIKNFTENKQVPLYENVYQKIIDGSK